MANIIPRVLLITAAMGLLPLTLNGCAPGRGPTSDAHAVAEAPAPWTGPNHIVPVRDEADFDLLMAQAEGPVLVEFHAIRRCATCQAIEPNLERLAFERLADVTVLSVDVDDLLPLARREGVGGIPTFLLYVNGEVTHTSQGFHSYEDLEAIVNTAH